MRTLLLFLEPTCWGVLLGVMLTRWVIEDGPLWQQLLALFMIGLAMWVMLLACLMHLLDRFRATPRPE